MGVDKAESKQLRLLFKRAMDMDHGPEVQNVDCIKLKRKCVPNIPKSMESGKHLRYSYQYTTINTYTMNEAKFFTCSSKQEIKNARVGLVVHTCNSQHLRGRDRWSSFKFKARLLCLVISRSARATH